MNRPPFAAPLMADFAAVRPRPSDSIVRAIVAKAHAMLDVAKPSDGTMRTRAATTPAMTAQTGWAAELAQSSVADLIVGDVTMGPVTTARELFRRSLPLSFGRDASVIVPTLVTAASGLDCFFGEGQPVPIRQYLFRGPRLDRHKMGFGVVLSKEMFLSVNAATYVRGAMLEGLAADLDPILFDTNSATAIRPAGLRAGVSGETPTAGGSDQALTTDISALIAKIKPVAGSQIALVASPDDYLKLMMRPQANNFPYPIFETSGLPAKTVLAVATNSLAVAFGDNPGFTVSDSATVHTDTAPTNIGGVGGVATPSTSLFQTDTLALRLIIDVSWCLRAPNSVAWVNATTW